ncbi:helix-turn-helix transcriptional regulator [Yersinia aleksiciae]|uniref:Positive transcription regulator evgA n=1 Tax=Yersinia aleksiciae TaxID=263819 RepID=A0A0T9T970_YERAE|nr:LuxR C-terminal-related transcriptional regulator [Yersinia aleksiciae]MDA5499401.1 LuxR C-terminal-related transcriptional regulator [Yersinia aleksiciae]NIK99004.1 response regulator transcription factor [Yersinia aleksiciae]WQC72498.1 LuxR C-terminal-related transcriptional regulator [Yersinia aleksiciae]CFQ55179.1 Positive transcription regulator evgA [Yersinia aleksiciae]CNK69226.1 Positive transcription regulator evgA [Yersinia aleksiciae]
MEVKQVIIQHPCAYTRISIERILKKTLNNESVNIASSVSSIADCHDHLVRFPVTHLVILNLHGEDYTSGDSLSLIVDWLRIHRPSCRVIVIANDFCLNLIKHYFHGVEQVQAVIAQNAPLSHFVTLLKRVFSKPVTPYKKQSYILSKRERTVLALLLQGKSNNDIAVYLQLSNKTISCHKRSAMGKLGIPTLQPMFMNVGIVTHLLNDLIAEV